MALKLASLSPAIPTSLDTTCHRSKTERDPHAQTIQHRGPHHKCRGPRPWQNNFALAVKRQLATAFSSEGRRARKHRGYGATVARLTPDQKVGSSNLSALILPSQLMPSLSLLQRKACISTPCGQQFPWHPGVATRQVIEIRTTLPIKPDLELGPCRR